MPTPQQLALTNFLARIMANALTASDQSLLFSSLSPIIPQWGFDDSGAPPDMMGNAGQIDESNARQWMAVLYAEASGLGAEGGTGAVGATFVYRPGGVPGGNVFTTTATLTAAIHAQPGPRWILVDDSIGPAHIVAGGPYDFDNTYWSSEGQVGTLIIDEGATFTSKFIASQGLTWENAATATIPWTATAFTFFWLQSFNGFVFSTGAIPLLHVTAAGNLSEIQVESDLGDGTHPVVTTDAGQTTSIFVRSGGTVAGNAFVGAGTNGIVADDTATVLLPLSASVTVAASPAALSRVRYVDGGTNTTIAPAGSIGRPFGTITKALTSIGVPVSAADANQTMQVLVTPSTIAAYTENPAVPAFRNLKFSAIGSSGGPAPSSGGIVVTGNVTWNNSAGGGAVAGNSSSLSFEDFAFTGTLTVTDDGSNQSSVTISATEGPNTSPLPGFLGNVVATGATALIRLFVTGAFVNSVTSTANATGAAVTLATGARVGGGGIVCKTLTATDSVLGSPAITVNAGSSMTFTRCTFSAGAALTAGAAGTITFDGPSKRSFDEAGGSIASGHVVVVGGYLAGEQNGAALTNADVSVSINGTGATAGFTAGGNHYTLPAATLGAAHTLTLLTGGGEAEGDTILVTRVDATANAYTIKNNGGTTIGVLPASKTNFLIATLLSTGDWGMTEIGSQ